METVSIGHHDDTCDGHYGCYNLEEIQSHQRLSGGKEKEDALLSDCSVNTDPNTHEAILENDPGQEKDKGLVAAVESRDVRGCQLLQGQEVQVIGQCQQD